METIKNYLDSMFRSLPKTDKVMRAKQELFQMMEDKYTELINNGISENEAIGTVISEFGNLDDLAEDLGITSENDAKKSFKETSRKVTLEEAKSFLEWRKKVGFFRGLGVLFCILSVTSPIMFDTFNAIEVLGPIFFFIMIAIGVGIIIYSNLNKEDFEYLRTSICSLDDKTYEIIQKERKEYTKQHNIIMSIAIGCFILCVVPSIVFDSFNSPFAEAIGASLLFIFVAVGVFLCIYSSIFNNALNYLYNLNSNPYFAKNMNNEKEENNQSSTSSTSSSKRYYNPSDWENTKDVSLQCIKNPTVRKILSIYWYTVTCIYLIISFLTFRWDITWIIWPVAALIYTFIKLFSTKIDEE